MDTEMSLSQAIRLGAMMRPQAFSSNNADGTCALWAAAEAVGIEGMASERGRIHPDYGALVMRFPILLSGEPKCPASHCTARLGTFTSVCWHLNDQHHWTREQIADYVETVETKPAVEAEAVEPVKA